MPSRQAGRWLGRVAARWMCALAAAHTRSSGGVVPRRTNATASGEPGRSADERNDRSLDQTTEDKRHSSNSCFPARSPPTTPEQQPPAQLPHTRWLLFQQPSPFLPSAASSSFFSHTQCPGCWSPVGGATFSHWSGEKEACPVGSGIAHVGTAMFPQPKKPRTAILPPFWRGVQGEEEEEVEAMVGGWRKMAAV